MFRRVTVVLSVLVIGIAACGGDDGDPQGASGDNWCTSPPTPTSQVSETQMTTAYPAAVGGNIVDGEYVLTRFEVYSPATADSNVRARLLKFDSGKIYSVMRDGGTTTVLGGSYSTSGDTITMQLTCPQSGEVSLKYTATGDEFWFQPPDEPNVQVYVRQP